MVALERGRFPWGFQANSWCGFSALFGVLVLWYVGSIRHALECPPSSSTGSKGLLGSPENVIILVVEHPESYVSHTIKHHKTLTDHTHTHAYTSDTFPFQSCAGQHPFEIRTCLAVFGLFFLKKNCWMTWFVLYLKPLQAQKGGEKPGRRDRILKRHFNWTGAARIARRPIGDLGTCISPAVFIGWIFFCLSDFWGLMSFRMTS